MCGCKRQDRVEIHDWSLTYKGSTDQPVVFGVLDRLAAGLFRNFAAAHWPDRPRQRSTSALTTEPGKLARACMSVLCMSRHVDCILSKQHAVRWWHARKCAARPRLRSCARIWSWPSHASPHSALCALAEAEPVRQLGPTQLLARSGVRVGALTYIKHDLFTSPTSDSMVAALCGLWPVCSGRAGLLFARAIHMPRWAQALFDSDSIDAQPSCPMLITAYVWWLVPPPSPSEYGVQCYHTPGSGGPRLP